MRVYTNKGTMLEAKTLEVTIDGDLLLDESIRIIGKTVVRVKDSPVIESRLFQSALEYIFNDSNNDPAEYAKAMHWIGMSYSEIARQLDAEGIDEADIAEIMEEV